MSDAPLAAGGNLIVGCDLYRATIDNEIVEDISDLLVDGWVQLNTDQAVKLTASFTVRQPTRITPYQDFLRPVLTIAYQDGRPSVRRQIGLFATRLPSGSSGTSGAIGTYEGNDLTAELATDALPSARNSASGSNVIAEVLAIVTGGAISRTNIPPTSRTYSKDITSPATTSRLTAANERLMASGWYELGMDLDGRISTPGATADIGMTEPFAAYTEDGIFGDIVSPGVQEDVYNVVKILSGDPASSPMIGTARNDDPSSRTSTVTLGRTRTYVETVSGDVTQDDLNARAARKLAELKSYYQTIQINVLPDPQALVPHQTVQLRTSGNLAAFAGRYWVRAAKIGFGDQPPPMQLECNRLTLNDTLGASPL